MTASRFNLFRDAHKALRILLADLVESAGRTDFTQASELARLRVETHSMLALVLSHAQLENTFIAPLLEQHCPGLAAMVEADHEDHESDLFDLSCWLGDIEAADHDAAARGHQFCLGLARIVAALLIHMSDEEQKVLPALWQAVPDASLEEVSRNLVAAVEAGERSLWLRLMLRAFSWPERMALLSRMRASMSEPAFDELLTSVRDVLRDDTPTGLQSAAPL